MKVLLLTASYGDGHHQVAGALCEALADVGIETQVFDCVRAVRGGGTAGERLYEWTTRFTPGLYGISYRWTRRLPEGNLLWRMLALPLRRVVSQAVAAYQPDAVLQLFPERVMLDLPRPLRDIWIGMVITDYSVHRRWFHEGVRAYFLPDRRMVPQVREFLRTGATLVDSGIPLRAQFQQGHDVPDVPAVPAVPYVLVATGGRGLFPDLRNTVQQLGNALPSHWIYVMCGKNQAMYAQVATLSKQWDKLRPLPYVEGVAHWLRKASFAVIKSGGLTVSECFASECPMLIYRPQPGQEADNAAFVERVGAGRVVFHQRDLSTALCTFADATSVQRMVEASREVAHPDAATVVADWVKAHLAGGGEHQTR